MPHKHERTKSRRSALQILYTCDIRNLTEAKCTPKSLMENEELDIIEGDLDDYAKLLVEGVWEHRGEFDEVLERLANNWAVERMAIVDLNIMRICAYEMKYCDDVPTSVAIDEAIELAKGFCESDSPKFINGVLGSYCQEIENNA